MAANRTTLNFLGRCKASICLAELQLALLWWLLIAPLSICLVQTETKYSPQEDSWCRHLLISSNETVQMSTGPPFWLHVLAAAPSFPILLHPSCAQSGALVVVVRHRHMMQYSRHWQTPNHAKSRVSSCCAGVLVYIIWARTFVRNAPTCDAGKPLSYHAFASHRRFCGRCRQRVRLSDCTFLLLPHRSYSAAAVTCSILHINSCRPPSSPREVILASK